MKLVMNLDEVAHNFDVSLEFMHNYNLDHCELRLLDEKNIALLEEHECLHYKNKLIENNMKAVAIASPIFKWYKNTDDDEILSIDNFGINPKLSFEEQDKVIQRTLKNADLFNINKIRIFSFLQNKANSGDIEGFFEDYHVNKLINLPYEFLIENELVCNIYSKSHLIQVSDYIDKNRLNNVKIWLDIANLYRNNEYIDVSFIRKIKHNIGYVHCKDYKVIGDNGQIEFVPLGNGILDYHYLLNLLNSELNKETIVSIETHAPFEDVKYTSSGKSITQFRKIMEGLND